ncbi:hypothetical protein GYN07_28855 (plasmid) [Rhizobium leguminosarum bv. viciae 248]|nr:hypothetical protein [Rhizobium leguminosarum]MCA2407160.1 hypothetical protein [Rhizobium leguminosarum]NKM60864.1 hypothetical protein [Rhizobium leguminosarum bv. viciae]QHW28345.1 hypothetical protein GYN07_28855 [Rhizobium leguminosarum bv. viciae 248]
MALGIVGTGITTLLVSIFTSLFDFIPRRLTTLGIGSSIEAFMARGPGDNYDWVLHIGIRNLGGRPLYIVRAVYFVDQRSNFRIYHNARHSQKYHKGYEVKFGDEWKELDTLVRPGEEVVTYVPLETVPSSMVPVRRGTLLLEYVTEGKPGIHRAAL